MEYQYRIKELKEWQKDSLFVVQKRVYCSNAIENFIYGSEWYYLNNKGSWTNDINAHEFTTKLEAEQFIKWCQLNDK